MKRIVAVLLLLAFIAGMSSAAMAGIKVHPGGIRPATEKPAAEVKPTVTDGKQKSSLPVITKQPNDVTVKKGKNATFKAAAEGDTGITWRLVSPDGDEEFLVKDVGKYFKGVTVSGKNSDALTLKKIPESMHGWSVYCTYANKAGRVVTRNAYIWISGMEQTVNTASGSGRNGLNVETWDDDDDDGYDDEPGTYTYTGSLALTLSVSGATLTANGYKGNKVDFTDAGKISFKVSASNTPAYWVINGARYDFDIVPKTITVKDLTYPMTIEAVAKGKSSSTLLSDKQLQAKRTGEQLLATSKNADLCFITASGLGKGGWFREFDFTDDFINLATEKKEKGGRITLRCRAYIAEGKKISYWKFNEAKMYFSSNVEEFVVTNLNETMEYHPVTAAGPTATPKTVTAAPVKMWTVNCSGCTFSGGGYSNARHGTVPDGTSITITSDYGAGGVAEWLINGKCLQKQAYVTDYEIIVNDDGGIEMIPRKVLDWIEITDTKLNRTVKSNMDIVCRQQIN